MRYRFIFGIFLLIFVCYAGNVLAKNDPKKQGEINIPKDCFNDCACHKIKGVEFAGQGNLPDFKTNKAKKEWYACRDKCRKLEAGCQATAYPRTKEIVNAFNEAFRKKDWEKVAGMFAPGKDAKIGVTICFSKAARSANDIANLAKNHPKRNFQQLCAMLAENLQSNYVKFYNHDQRLIVVDWDWIEYIIVAEGKDKGKLYTVDFGTTDIEGGGPSFCE